MSNQSRNSQGGVLTFVIGLLTVATILWFALRRSLQKPEPAIRDAFASSPLKPANVNLWVAVSKLETGNYKSLLCTKYKNLFGMTVPSGRITTAIGSVKLQDGEVVNNFCIFSSYFDSTRDLILWMASTNFPAGEIGVDEFVAAMRTRGYFTGNVSAYTAAIKSLL